jgi:hypothetical protein
LSTLLGTIVGIVGTWGGAIIKGRFDDRRHLRELAITTAIRYWEHDTELAKLRATARPDSRQFIAPLDTYIIHTLLLAELVSSKKITPDKIVGELARIRAISDAAAESAKPERKENS